MSIFTPVVAELKELRLQLHLHTFEAVFGTTTESRQTARQRATAVRSALEDKYSGVCQAAEQISTFVRSPAPANTNLLLNIEGLLHVIDQPKMNMGSQAGPPTGPAPLPS